ncbi:MAG: RdgB/HAM1 family non-canonical purine NTP pyrophosphatase [Coriobacteriia bacterium]|nr:RdgB/HAM1 family non-canonical purine NTP pyrophosphatase [Coriobacteriia bacterium]
MIDPLIIIVATNNPHKVEEIQRALRIEGVQFVPISAVIEDWISPEEDADTFEGNARIKARAVFEATGIPTLADDSGLVVDVLGGDPGVHSSRYAGIEGDSTANNEKLLDEMRDVAEKDRSARFTTTLILLGLDTQIPHAPAELIVTGDVEGCIGREPIGDEGFGYDPLFWPDDTPGKTMAQLSMDEKNAISHRGNALKAMAEQLPFNRA